MPFADLIVERRPHQREGNSVYNGTSWTTAPAITFTDGTTMAQLNYGWLFKNREFFLKNGTLDAYYLPVNAVGGAAALFPLGGVMKKGGSLLTGFSWSLESGDGLNDMPSRSPITPPRRWFLPDRR